MNKLIKEIDDIENKISCIEFKDYLSEEDRADIREYEKRIEELKEQLKGYTGIVVEVLPKDSTKPWYLTSHPILCFCFSPTIFDSEEEAQEYLDRAKFNRDNYDITFKEWRL